MIIQMKKKIFILIWLIVMIVSGYVLYDAYLYFFAPRAKVVGDRLVIYKRVLEIKKKKL